MTRPISSYPASMRLVVVKRRIEAQDGGLGTWAARGYLKRELKRIMRQRLDQAVK